MKNEWQIEAAKDPNTAPEILISLFTNEKCHEFLMSNPSSPQGLLISLGVKESFTEDPMDRRISAAGVLKNAPTPEIVDRILKWTEGSLNVLQAGEDPNSISYTETIKQYFYPSAARNPNTPEKYLREFAKSNYDVTIFYLLPNPSLPKDLVEQFAQKLASAKSDEEVWLYRSIAENVNLSREYFLEFSTHEERIIRTAVARNPNSPEEAMLRLAEDNESSVFFGLSFNPALTEKALLKLCNRTRSDIGRSTQWVGDYYNNLRKRAQSGDFSLALKDLVQSTGWPSPQ